MTQPACPLLTEAECLRDRPSGPVEREYVGNFTRLFHGQAGVNREQKLSAYTRPLTIVGFGRLRSSSIDDLQTCKADIGEYKQTNFEQAGDFRKMPTTVCKRQGELKQAALLTLTALALALAPAEAKVRLGDPLPAPPWQAAHAEPAPAELVVIYAATCKDTSQLWRTLGQVQGVPVRAVFAEGQFAAADAPPAGSGVNVWRGAEATAFARQLRVAHYPTLLLVERGRLLGVWEGQPDAAGEWQRALGLEGLELQGLGLGLGLETPRWNGTSVQTALQ